SGRREQGGSQRIQAAAGRARVEGDHQSLRDRPTVPYRAEVFGMKPWLWLACMGLLSAQLVSTGSTDQFPLSSALSPDGKYLLVLNCGLQQPSITVFRTDSMKETARVPVADAWLGLTFSPDGRHVYTSGGARDSVFDFTFSTEGELKQAREIP